MAETRKKKSSDRRKAAGSRQPAGGEGGGPAGPRELILIVRPDVELRATPDGMASMADAPTDDLNDVLSAARATAAPLFGPTEERVRQETFDVAPSEVSLPDLSLFYRVEAPEGRLDELSEELVGLDAVEAAYVKPPAEPAVLNDMAPASEEAPPTTPDFTASQLYLDAPLGGINARWAWTRPGGRGANVRVIDIEGAWRFSHEDLIQNQGGVVAGTQSTDLGWRNHGTAVVGVIGGDVNSFGITGIAPDATVSAISIFGPGMGSAAAIRAAASRLRAGDILLIELHRPGPRHNFAARSDQAGYIAVEWWDDDFAAIAFAAARGVIVVEAAGNGAEDLDDPIYSTRPSNFAASWTNPFNRANRDSRAVLVGAGAPPPGTHGRNHGPDRSRLGFSNFGASVDAQGWGREVTTTGYGNLQGGTSEDTWYTDTFSGTSSASPIVVGALASVQGMLGATNRPLLTPARARQCLRSTGSPQQDAPGRPSTQRIGNRPDIPALLTCAGGKAPIKEIKEIKERPKEFVKETKEVKERPKELVKERPKELVKETKETVKDIKEAKEFKEIDKDLSVELKSPKEAAEGGVKVTDAIIDPGLQGIRPGDVGAGAADLAQRLAALEATVGELVHFISAELRPDLAGSALDQEPDTGEWPTGG
jgi:hypothetical protein